MALMIDEHLVWLLVRGRGVTTFFLGSTPHEKANENLIQTRVSSEFSAGVGSENNFSLYPNREVKQDSCLHEIHVWLLVGGGG